MNVNWRVFGKNAIIIGLAGVTLTTVILIVRHLKQKKADKKDEEKQVEHNKEVNENIKDKLTAVVHEDDLQRLEKEMSRG